MQIDLTQGSITKTMLRFAVPMIWGNLLQQLYNIVDTLIVGQYLGADALAAVGSAYTLMTFLTSIFLGLCMGSGAIFAIRYGEKNMDRLKEDMFVSFVMTAGLTLFINIFIFWKLDLILHFLSVPEDVYALMRTYLWAVFWGIVATFVLRAVGNSTAPLLFLGVGAVTNIVLDLVFILVCHWGVAGAAWATVIAQWISGVLVLCSGCSKLQDAIDLKRLDYGSWLGLLIVAAINIILGVVLIYNPFKAAILLFRVLGVVLILSGAGDCFSTIYFARKLRRFKQEQDALDSTFEEVDPKEQN